MRRHPFAGLGVLLAAVTLVYLGHFHNGFHFDDFHAVVGNPYIRDLHWIPRFFADARTFSILASNRTYRPLVSTSLAIDYALGRGLGPFFFQLSTFCWFLIQLVLMFLLFRQIFDRARPDPRNSLFALLATAWYGLHPAMAETVNYIVQRGDLYSTLGPVAGLLVYISFPRWRSFGLYLIPVAAAILSKPPAMIFPALLFVYVWLFECEPPRRLRRALWRSVPSLVCVSALLLLSARMTPREFNPGLISAYAYRITQPWVTMRYFRTFLLPGNLSADTDLAPARSIWQGEVWLGFLFVSAIVALAMAAARRREWRPVSFGLWWFLLALAPTAVYPLAEVENDHRMFFPFVGLVLAATWPVALWVYRRPGLPRSAIAAVAAGASLELALLAFGTMQRNLVWHTEESLWRDVTVKSPRNPRGHLNYGAALANSGQLEAALKELQIARRLAPEMGRVEADLGLVTGELHQSGEAEEHFRRAIALIPLDANTRTLYAEWLKSAGREAEAIDQLRTAVKIAPDNLDPAYLLMGIFAARNSWPVVQRLADYVLQRFPAEAKAKAYLLMATSQDGWDRSPRWLRTPETILDLAELYYQAKRCEDALHASLEASRLDPGNLRAYDSTATIARALGNCTLSVQASLRALQIQKHDRAAQRNLAECRKRQ